jgi:hypothetical protein
MHDSGLELRVTEIIHSLIEVITRLQLVATAGTERQQQRPAEQGEFIAFHQRSSLDESGREAVITSSTAFAIKPNFILSVPIVLAIAATIEAEPGSIS